ncbi:MAG: hypothetical protein FJ197_10980 [Gammaproteobacteria bacterium]|nr:hypothetical protein [Gammaproteobacteria bacterium]
MINLANGSVLGLDLSTIDAPYRDPEGNALAIAEWQLASDEALENLLLVRELEAETELHIAAGVLDPGSEFFARTRHIDVEGGISEWSEIVSFTAASALEGDGDRDGIADDSKVVGSHDTNGNGVDDAAEGICHLLDAEGGEVVGIQTDEGELSCYRSLSAEGIKVPEASFPYGLFSFRVAGLRVDPENPARATISVYVPKRPRGKATWYKLDPATGRVFELTGAVTWNGHTALIELVDGGPGDFDGVVNGVIVDPSGPVVVTESGSSIGLLLPGLMVLVGLRRRRRS